MPRKPKLCGLCGGSLEIVIRPTQCIDATYSEDDPFKGDEHLELCPVCWQSFFHMAKGTGQVIVARLFGPIFGVYYPNRKTPDVYVAGPEETGMIKCCQTGCEIEFPSEELSDHIDSHDTRRGNFKGNMKKRLLWEVKHSYFRTTGRTS